jgi:zinc protease
VLGYYVTSRQYGLPADYWDRYPDRVMAVSQAQVQAAAKKYLEASRLQIVAVTEPKIAPLFKSYGRLMIYDTEGRRTGSQ